MLNIFVYTSYIYLEYTGIIRNSLPGLSLVIADLVRRLISYVVHVERQILYRFDSPPLLSLLNET